jgi:hypothetical protein
MHVRPKMKQIVVKKVVVARRRRQLLLRATIKTALVVTHVAAKLAAKVN